MNLLHDRATAVAGFDPKDRWVYLADGNLQNQRTGDVLTPEQYARVLTPEQYFEASKTWDGRGGRDSPASLSLVTGKVPEGQGARNLAAIPAKVLQPQEQQEAPPRAGIGRGDIASALLQVLGQAGQTFAANRALKTANRRDASSQARANLINALSRRAGARGTRTQPQTGLLGLLSGVAKGAGEAVGGITKLQRQREQQDFVNRQAERRTQAQELGGLSRLFGRRGGGAPSLTDEDIKRLRRIHEKDPGSLDEYRNSFTPHDWLLITSPHGVLPEASPSPKPPRPLTEAAISDHRYQYETNPNDPFFEWLFKNISLSDRARITGAGAPAEKTGAGPALSGAQKKLLHNAGASSPDVDPREIFDGISGSLGIDADLASAAINEIMVGQLPSDEAPSEEPFAKEKEIINVEQMIERVNILSGLWDEGITGFQYSLLEHFPGVDFESEEGQAEAGFARRLFPATADLSDELAVSALHLAKMLQGAKASNLDLKTAARSLPLQADADVLAQRKFDRLREAAKLKAEMLSRGDDSPVIIGVDKDGVAKLRTLPAIVINTEQAQVDSVDSTDEN